MFDALPLARTAAAARTRTRIDLAQLPPPRTPTPTTPATRTQRTRAHKISGCARAAFGLRAAAHSTARGRASCVRQRVEPKAAGGRWRGEARARSRPTLRFHSERAAATSQTRRRRNYIRIHARRKNTSFLSLLFRERSLTTFAQTTPCSRKTRPTRNHQHYTHTYTVDLAACHCSTDDDDVRTEFCESTPPLAPPPRPQFARSLCPRAPHL